MKFRIKDDIPQKELFEYLVKNRKQLIEKKKSMPVNSEPFELNITEEMEVKARKGEIAEDATSFSVKVVANTSMYTDNDMDVLGISAGQKSIDERGTKGKNVIPHLNGHIHTLDALVGDVKNIYYQNLKAGDLGIMTTVPQIQGLILESEIIKEYNPKLFNLYKSDRVKQHSIGMQYVKIELAVNDEEYKEEFAIWQKYYDNIINKDRIDKSGYFWYVSEFKLLEISAVLFGSNELTPTLEIGKSKPSEDDTYKDIEPSAKDTQTIDFNYLTQNIFKAHKQ